MDRIGIGVLSFAHGHSVTYCTQWETFDDVRLVACWDDDETRGRSTAERFGMTYRPRMEDVLDDPAVDAVVVACETNRHAEVAVAAAAAGKGILCQKPMALTLADCDRIIDAVERTGVKFEMAFQMRHDPVNQKIRELIQGGTIGALAVLRRRHCISVLFNEGFVTGPTKWHVDPEKNMGMFMDDASHATDWFQWILGDPVSVIAEIDNVVTDVAPDDNGAAIYRFGSGEIGILLNSSTTLAGENTTEAYGDKGVLIQDYGDAPSCAMPRPTNAVPLRMYLRDAPEKDWQNFNMPIPTSQGERIAAIAGPFVEYLKGEKGPAATALDGRTSVEMVLGAYRSAREGRRVMFPLEA